MYASIIITLPSEFNGAAVHLSHSGKSEIIDIASSSAFSTSVLAWYSDVYHAVKPVVSGYRLALSYNLVIPPSNSSLRPRAQITDPAVAGLRHVLQSWLASANNSNLVPRRIIWNLSHQYSESNLETPSPALKGDDSQLLSIFRSAIEGLPLTAYLANLELTERGYAEHHDAEFKKGWKKGGAFYSSDDELDEDQGGEYQMPDDPETEVKVVHAVTLDGEYMDLDTMQIYEDDVDMMPGKLKAKGVDDEEYEGFQGNVRENLTFN